MSDKVDNLILEHLRSIRGTLSDHGERRGRIELRLSAMEQTLGSLDSLSPELTGKPRALWLAASSASSSASIWRAATPDSVRNRH